MCLLNTVIANYKERTGSKEQQTIDGKTRRKPPSQHKQAKQLYRIKCLVIEGKKEILSNCKKRHKPRTYTFTLHHNQHKI